MSTSSAYDTPPVAAPVDEATRRSATVAARAADERAKLARDAADRAKQAAKAARREASKATAEADDLRDRADPESATRHRLTPDQAKERLLQAAREFDPMRGVRESIQNHPFVLVGTAACTGAVLGSSGRALLSLSALTGTVLKLARPLALAAAQFAAAKVAANQAAEQSADQAASEAAHEAAHHAAHQAAEQTAARVANE